MKESPQLLKIAKTKTFYITKLINNHTRLFMSDVLLPSVKRINKNFTFKQNTLTLIFYT